MSEAVTNSEIEDVLSSIRRLVSEDISGESQSKLADSVADPGRNRGSAQAPARLVLTPAFRVSPVDELADALLVRSENLHQDAPVAAEASEKNIVPEADYLEADNISAPGHEGDISETEAAADDFDIQGDSRLLDFLSDTTGSEEDITADEDETAFDVEIGAKGDVEPAQQGDSSDIDTEPLNSAEHALEVAGQGGDNSALEASDQDVRHEDDAIKNASNVTDLEQPTGFEVKADVAQSAERLNSLEKTIADLEAVVSETDGEWEPDGSEAEGSMPEIEPLQWHHASANRTLDRTEQPPSWSDGTSNPFSRQPRVDDVPLVDETFIAHSPSAEDASDEEGENGSMFDETETVLDEEALRALVSELVREELQGSLGERITRSVRKLVRREIQLALARKEFD